jgi:hypothetical protein
VEATTDTCQPVAHDELPEPEIEVTALEDDEPEFGEA